MPTKLLDERRLRGEPLSTGLFGKMRGERGAEAQRHASKVGAMAGNRAGKGKTRGWGSREWGEAHSGPGAARAKQAADRSAGHWEVGRAESQRAKRGGLTSRKANC